MSAGAATRPLPDQAATLAHLQTLYASAPADHWISIVGITKAGTVTPRWARADNLERAAGLAHRLNGDGQNVYVGMASVDTPTRQAIDKRKGRVTSDEAGAVVGAYVEIDLAGQHKSEQHLPPDEAAALGVVEASGLPRPSLALHSGGGLHLYWLFAEPYIVDTPDERRLLAALVRGVQATIRRAFAPYDWHLDGTADLARVLRLGGTINFNGDHPRLARLLWRDGPTVTTADLEPFADWREAAPATEPITEGERLTAGQRAALVALFQPAWRVGSRRPIALYGAGWLAKQGVPEVDARLIFLTIATLADDGSDLPTVASAVAASYQDARAGAPVAGWSKLTAPAAPLVPPATAVALDQFMRRRAGVATISTPAEAAPAEPVSGDMYQAAHAGSCPGCDRLRRAYTLMHERARRLQRLALRKDRELGQLRRLTNHRAYRGRADLVEAVVETIATAPGDAGEVRIYKEHLTRKLGRTNKTLNEAISPALACGALVERTVERVDADGQPRTRCYLEVPGLARTGDASLDRINIRSRLLTAADAPRLTKGGHTHGGRRAGAGRPKRICPDCGKLASVVAERKARAYVLDCGHIAYELDATADAPADPRAVAVHSFWSDYQGKPLRLPDGTTGTLLLLAVDLATDQVAAYVRVAGEAALRRLDLDALDRCTRAEAAPANQVDFQGPPAADPAGQVSRQEPTENLLINLNSNEPACDRCGTPALRYAATGKPYCGPCLTGYVGSWVGSRPIKEPVTYPAGLEAAGG